MAPQTIIPQRYPFSGMHAVANLSYASCKHEVAFMATELKNFLVQEGGSNACKWWPTPGASAGDSPADVLLRLKDVNIRCRRLVKKNEINRLHGNNSADEYQTQAGIINADEY